MSYISFSAPPLPVLMPTAINTAQCLIRDDLTKAGLRHLAELRPDGRIAPEFDQHARAEAFDALRGEALLSLDSDAQAGQQFVRVKYHERLDRFEAGALDPDTARLSFDRWALMMATHPWITAVWGFSHPVPASYLDGSSRWESRCEAIVVVDVACRWEAVDLVRGYIAVGSSRDAPCWSWAGQFRTANTELAQIFKPMLWAGGVGAVWGWLSSYLCYPDLYDGLPEEDRIKLLLSLSEVGVADRVIRLHRSATAGAQGGW